MLFNDDKHDSILYELVTAMPLSIGGIGIISKYKTYVYKSTFNIHAFINNINMYYTLIEKNIPCATLLDYCIYDMKHENFRCNDLQIRDMRILFLKCKSVFNDILYVLKYDAYDGNAYSLFKFNKNDKYIYLYFKIWIYINIFILNKNGIYHNDLKMDNILICKKKRSIERIDNVIITNRTPWTFILNDFDVTTNCNIYSDLKCAHDSMNHIENMINENEINKPIEYLLNYWFNREFVRKLLYVDLLKPF